MQYILKLLNNFLLLSVLNVFFLSFSGGCWGQSISTDEAVYAEIIYSVGLHPPSHPEAFPLIRMHSDDKLDFYFDDLSGDPNEYSYRIVHCTSNWEQSDLMPMQYIEGINEDLITQIDYSSAQYSNYTHFSFLFPNNGFKFILAGNYLIEVYADADPDKVVIRRRFVVLDERVKILAKNRRSTDIELARYKQSLEFMVEKNGYNLSNPYADMDVHVIQNKNWKTSIKHVQPTFVQGTRLSFLLEDELDFFAGNEYRFLDLKSIHYKPANVGTITLDFPITVDLLTDKKRASKQYEFFRDINLTSYYGSEDGLNHKLDADYMDVTFSLYSPSKLNQDVYVYGDFSRFRLLEDGKLHYNANQKVYEKTITVKQGLHHYKYVTLNADQSPDFMFTEGSHWQTENDYYILVYHKAFEDREAKLIGFQKINSLHIFED